MINDKRALREYLDKYHTGHSEFHQAILKWYEHIKDIYLSNDEYQQENVLERMIEPDKVHRFRVVWRDDSGAVRVNRAWRVQHNNSSGPYKGGIRFSPNVNESVLKFLAFEQTFKNSLTGLPMGGGKGGVDINTKELSLGERERVCKAFMDELHKYIGDDIDIPAGDVGVSATEIGFMYGQYVKLTDRVTGSMTGKGLSFGGSSGRQEATGYGCIYFLESLLAAHDMDIKDKAIAISGAGNVATFAVEKAIAEGAKVITMSDSQGTLYCKDGFDEELLEQVKNEKLTARGALKNINAKHTEYLAGKTPWHIPCDIAMPCAVQNELDEKAAKELLKNDVKVIAEGANMPLTNDAEELLQNSGVIIAPSKAANAGGVAVSGLERTQNALHMTWPIEKVDKELRSIMQSIHEQCTEHIHKYKGVYNYSKGADITSFNLIAKSIIALGVK